MLAILQATRAQELEGATKAEYKRLIVEALRRHPTGLQTPELARALGLEHARLVRLLDEMQQDGVLASHVTAEQHTVWQVKGLGVRAG
jgi:hypothetical protein